MVLPVLFKQIKMDRFECFFGHQLVTHLKEGDNNEVAAINLVDGKNVPVPHFGVVLQWDEWHKFTAKIKTKKY